MRYFKVLACKIFQRELAQVIPFCSNALAGIKSSRLPLVIPRAHDCITHFMGSKEKYADYFNNVQGTYFYTQGWLDLGLDLKQSDIERKRNEYMEKFDGDEDTVEYLLDLDKEMLKNYRYITYITWPGMPNENGIKRARKLADDSGMELLMYEGSNRLMADFVNGNWNEEDFLIVQPGQTIQPSFDKMVIKAAD